MIINTSVNIYNQLQTTSETAEQKAASPLVIADTVQTSAPSSDKTTISGKGLMMSRLFGGSNANPPVQTQLTKETMGMSSVNFLTTSDRETLSNLYAKAQSQGTDLRYVDDLAYDLGTYRMFGGVMDNVNTSGIYDDGGHKQTFKFTDADASTAASILSSGNLSASGLDSGFLTYELDPGYSFNHRANFQYLGSLVNRSTGTGGAASNQFSSYDVQGKHNYLIETSDEVTLHTEAPDYGSINGVFYVTEKGMKNGFRLEGGQVVQDPSFAEINASDSTPFAMLNAFLKINNKG